MSQSEYKMLYYRMYDGIYNVNYQLLNLYKNFNSNSHVLSEV